MLASYTTGARERLAGLLEDHGPKSQQAADSWQEALGAKSSRRAGAAARPRLRHPDVAVLTEQDMLGDRLVRRRKKRKAAAAFLEELAALSPGDLVVHADHGIGRYEGLTQIPVSKSPHDCVALEYAGGNKLYVPVENIELLRATAAKRGRDARPPRWRGVAAAQVADEGTHPRDRGRADQDRGAPRDPPGHHCRARRSYPQFVDRFPYEETDDQDRAIEDVIRI